MPWLYLLLWWIPKLTIFSLFYRLRSISEHACTSGQDDFTHTRTTLSSNFVRYFIAPLNVNYHLEHHLFMFVPCYKLKKAHEMILEKHKNEDLEIKSGYVSMLRSVLI